MNKIKLRAVFSSLDIVLDFIRDVLLKKNNISEQCVEDIILASEEILVNIISYAYKGLEIGDIEVAIKVLDKSVSITFIDTGMPFDVLKHKVAGLNLSVDERKIGGLGIHIVKHLVDNIVYKRELGKNILKIEKSITDNIVI